MARKPQRKRRFLLIPFLFVLSSLLQLAYASSHVVSPDQILRPLIVLWLLVALLIWPAYRLTYDWHWATVLLTVFVLGVLSSSDFFSIVLATFALGCICWLAFIRLKRAKIQLTHFMYILAGTSLFFSAYALVVESTALAPIFWMDYRQSVSGARRYSLPSLSSSQIRPDIYYIVLDGYARSDILHELFDFDNSKFVSDLQEKG
ncbi:MAG TPA: hypothetical protein VFY83_00505, partial [Anaerolineales bacterium]|nr:hypothetical protein [Anaerolineales bacterium]